MIVTDCEGRPDREPVPGRAAESFRLTWQQGCAMSELTEIGPLLLDILDDVSFVCVERDPDGFHLTALPKDPTGKRYSTYHRVLATAIRELVPGKFPETTHECSKCHLPFPVSHFYRHRAGARSGKTIETRWPWYCQECERKRVWKYDEAKRKKKAEEAARKAARQEARRRDRAERVHTPIGDTDPRHGVPSLPPSPTHEIDDTNPHHGVDTFVTDLDEDLMDLVNS